MKSTVVNEIYAMDTRFTIHPMAGWRIHGRAGSSLRPRRQWIRIGRQYDISKHMTAAALSALNALEGRYNKLAARQNLGC